MEHAVLTGFLNKISFVMVLVLIAFLYDSSLNTSKLDSKAVGMITNLFN